MSRTFRCDVRVKTKLKVTVFQDDIVNVKAGAVVSGEGPCLVKESFVTQALQNVSPSFRDVRHALKREFKELKLWTVKASALGIPFLYVIHAVLDAQRNSKWLKNMKTLYHRILKTAECLPIRDVAIPLLGAGYAETEKSLAIQAMVESIHEFHPKNVTKVFIVNKDPTTIDMILTQFEYEMSGNKEYNDGLLTKVRSAFGDIKFQVSDFIRGPEERYRNDTKSQQRRKYQEDKDLERRQIKEAIRRSEEEMRRTARLERKTESTWHTPGPVPDLCPTSTWYLETPASELVSYKMSPSTARNNYDMSASRRSLGSNDTLCYENTTAEDMETEVTKYGSIHAEIKRRQNNNNVTTDVDLTCPICLSVIMEPKQLHKCGHIFCVDCIEQCFRDFKPVCPSCNMVYGVIIGNQPDGTMDVGFSDQSLPGYPGCGSITIIYIIPSGIQQEGHPNPGQPFTGTTRRAYLPDCKEGKAVLILLKIAFDRKLTFTIGRSTTTGQEGVVTWNDIHHKTNIHGGPTRYGYPDPTYLSRVREELSSKGVTDEIMFSP